MSGSGSQRVGAYADGTMEVEKGGASGSATTRRDGDRRCLVFLTVTTILFVIATIVLAIILGLVNASYKKLKDEQLPQCGPANVPGPVDAFEPSAQEMKASVLDQMSAAEIDEVITWLNGQTDLNLEAVPDGTKLNINYVTAVELFPLVKADVLAFLDQDGPAPARYARVFITLGAESTPEAREYKVGPLGGTMTKSVVRTIPYNSRKPDFIEYGLLDSEVIQPAATRIETLCQESFGAILSDGGLSWTDTAPRGNTTNERKTWIWFMREVPGRYEHALELSMRIQHEGPDPSTWKVISVVYNYQTFSSIDALVAAYNANTLTKLDMNESDAAKASSSIMRPDLPVRPLENRPVPRQISPGGPRFTVTGNHVNYLGWSFEIVNRPSAGLQFFDVRFKNERIMYELSIQEAFASYGGMSPFEAGSVYMDSAWGMGTSTWSLIPGVDCPEDSVFMDFTVYQAGSADSNSMRMPAALCVFESNLNIPLRRHYDNDGAGGFNFVGGTPLVALVVRVCAAVYNYDYVYDFIFYPNGAVDSKVSATGYIQGAPFVPARRNDLAQWGVPSQQFGMGNVHDHMVCYKIDLDVAGTANSFEAQLVKTKTFTNLPGYPYPYPMKYLQHVTFPNETTSAISAMKTGYYLITNNAAKNAWDVPRSYRVVLMGAGTNPLGDAPIMRANAWTKYMISVTQRHESEPFATVQWDQNIPQHPLLNFDSFFNAESLQQQDLVVWATVAMSHVTSSEDVPITPSNLHSGWVSVRPHNYFDSDAASDLTNAVYIVPDGNKNVVTRYNAPPPQCIPPVHPFNYIGRTDTEGPKSQF